MAAAEEAATAVAAFAAYEARALSELARCASRISPSLHSLLPEIAERLSTQLAAARANGAFWSQMLEDMDLLDAPSEEACTSSSVAPPSGGEAAESAQADVHGVLLQLRREWSEEGAVERHQSFDPILGALARFLPFDHWSAGNRGAAGGAAGGGSAAAEGSTERRVRVLVRRCPAMPPSPHPPPPTHPTALPFTPLAMSRPRTRRSLGQASEGSSSSAPCGATKRSVHDCATHRAAHRAVVHHAVRHTTHCAIPRMQASRAPSACCSPLTT